jgi:hypothetical protein
MATTTGTGIIIKCYTTNEVNAQNGVVDEKPNGVVSVFIPNNLGVLTPVQLTSQCCKVLNPNYYFDIDTQKCRWSESSDDNCVLKNPFKLVLNPKGNDGTIFYVDDNQTCDLSIKFKYLFKLSCESLNNIINPSVIETQLDPMIVDTIRHLENELQSLHKECSWLNYQIESLQEEIANTPYSIICNDLRVQVSDINYDIAPVSFRQTGFASNMAIAPFSFEIVDYGGVNLCLTEPDGLLAWANILGAVNYQEFLNGNSTSFTCTDVNTLTTQNSNNMLADPIGPVLFNTCDIPFGTKTNLIKTLSESLIQQQECDAKIREIETQITELTNETNNNGSCRTPIEFFETFNVSVTLDLVTGGTVQTILKFDLFDTIGEGQLYNYLLAHPEDSGFYVCGDNSNGTCIPMTLDAADINNSNTSICDSVMNNLLINLYAESGLSGTTNGSEVFNTELPFNGLASKWLEFNEIVSDPDIITLITNQKIKISFEINNACGDFCVLVDEIVLDKVCKEVNQNNIFITQSPGFEFERLRDNKKSWIANTTPENRFFSISNNLGSNPIRQTNYDVNDERLVINTKEIDLDINLAGAIETDIWCYLSDNQCLLTGITNCLPCACGNKTFQDDKCFDFMDGYSYDFMDGLNTGSPSLFNQSNCCGDDMIDFTKLLTQPLSAITTIEDFKYFLTSELIDAKNRQTISSYPTLRALYDRYMNSGLYCGNESSKFDYMTMDQFAGLIGNYWVDIVEQVIPATTIWGSVKIYSNTIFDQQKYKYKQYSSLFCENQYLNTTLVSPINGSTGVCASVEVIITPLNLDKDTKAKTKNITSKCDSICVAQMNSGSEFVGTVAIIKINNDSSELGLGSASIGGGRGSYTVIEKLEQ